MRPPCGLSLRHVAAAQGPRSLRILRSQGNINIKSDSYGNSDSYGTSRVHLPLDAPHAPPCVITLLPNGISAEVH
ncbi:MAG: hypothetical protein ABIY71_05495 [Flavobacteriales bacterium]